MTTVASSRPPLLSDELVDQMAGRAGAYDRENRFCTEDFDDLRQAGYLTLAVPEELGGAGLSLAGVCQEQRRLARRSAPTALAVNMHLINTGVAADLYRSGDTTQRWVLEEAADGAIFAYGNAEAGNDLPLLLSTARAERADGGYRLYGHKVFGSLSPVWTYMEVHATDASDAAAPKIVHAFLGRDTPGVRIEHTWDTMGMRATQSDDTILDGAFVPDERVARVVPPGFAGADQFVLAVFAWAELTFANVYIGQAERAVELAVDGLHNKTSIALGGRPMAYNPMIQHTFAEMALTLEPMVALAERVADDWSLGVDHGGLWAAKLVAAKHTATEGAKRVVDLAMEASGGAGMFRRNELERLYRDVRAGGFHPANPALVHEVVGKTVLGILGQEPRW